MTRSVRFPFRGTAVLLAVTLAALAPAAQAAPGPVPPPDAPAHATLEDALGAVGMDRAAFDAQAGTADRLAAASEEYAVRYPAAFAGVRLVGARGQVGVIRGADDEEALVADARARGFATFAAPAQARSLERTADRVESWVDSLPPAQRGEVTVTQVDPATGEVTVVLTGDRAAPVPPADLGAQVRRDTFRRVQSAGSSGGAGAPVAPVVPAGAVLGGDRYLSQDPVSGTAYYCSFGFHGLLGGEVVNITAAHCGLFADVSAPTGFRAGTVSLGSGQPLVGRFDTDRADAELDAALVTVDPEDADRFRNDLVRSSGGEALRITGVASPVVGQTVCKYGQRTAYTCGKVRALDSASVPATRKVTFGLCVLPGDSGGVIFTGSRALAITSETSAIDPSGTPYPSCAAAESEMPRVYGQGPRTIGVAVNAITATFPGLTVATA